MNAAAPCPGWCTTDHSVPFELDDGVDYHESRVVYTIPTPEGGVPVRFERIDGPVTDGSGGYRVNFHYFDVALDDFTEILLRLTYLLPELQDLRGGGGDPAELQSGG